MRYGLANPGWFLMAQPYDLPERMYGCDPDHFYLRQRDIFDPEALEDYLRRIRAPGTIHAMCEDHRAGATFDNDLDEAERGRRRIACPLLVLWSAQGDLSWWDPIAIWRGWVDDVSGTGIDCGHYLAEEAPGETYRHLRDFFATS